MSIIAWLILGLISGFIASKIVNKTGEGVVIDIVLGRGCGAGHLPCAGAPSLMLKAYTKEHFMKNLMRTLALIPLLIVSIGAAHAGSYADTIAVFKNAGASGTFFDKSYAYAVFPTVGSGALGVGGAYGKGRVYVHGVYTGNATIGQVSVGFQAGGKAYSQIVFFEDKRALDEFESGNFEFGADASVVAITAGANAGAATNGTSAGVSAGQNDATTRGIYQKGMAVFTVAKGGLMYSASIAGQKFSYSPRAAN